MDTNPPQDLTATLVNRLIEAASRLDSATDCLACAEAAVALNSRESAHLVLERMRGIAGQDFRFGGPEYLVIRDLAVSLRTLRDGFADAEPA